MSVDLERGDPSRLRVGALGLVPSELRSEIEALAQVTWVTPWASAASPHLLLLGEGAPPVDPEATAKMVVLSAGDPRRGGDLALGALEGEARRALVATALKMAHWCRQAEAAAPRVRPPFEAGWLPTEARRIIENEFHRALRYRHPLSLLLLAVDGYDAMVRLHGPEAAGHYLETLETALLPSLRRADRILRSGAHELAILLPETDRTGARVAGERLLGQTRRLLVRPPAGVEQRSLPIKTTASVGGCDAPREDLDESGLMIELARAALEVARMKGGDRARLHGDPVD